MRHTTTLLIGLTLVAAACGGGSATATTAAGGTGEQTPIVMPDTTVGSGGNPTNAAPDTPSDLPDSDYPDIVVKDLAGPDINLRTLALEPQPVLLWFWAPH